MKIISKLMTLSIAGACMCTIIGALSNTAQAVSIQENEDTSAVTMVVSGKTDSTATTAITDATSYEDTYETTTATTAAQHTRERTKSVTVSVVDAETGKKMSDIDVELVKCFTVKVNGIIEISGEKEVLDSWNTTETSVYQSGKYAYDSEKPYYLAALIEKIPDGYIYRNHSDYALFAVGWDFTENTDETYDIVIELQKDPADEKYPLTGSYSAKISFGNVYLGRNYTEAELAELGLNCTLSDTCTDEVIQTWNTKDHAYITIENLEYDFQSYAAADNRYLLTIANLPDEYAIHDTNTNQISVGIKIDAALNSDETIPMIIWLRNDSIDEPYITSITSTEITTTTTTIVTDITTMTEDTTVTLSNDYEYEGAFRVSSYPWSQWVGEEPDFSTMRFELLVMDSDGKFNSQIVPYSFSYQSGLHSDYYMIDTSAVDNTKEGNYEIKILPKAGEIITISKKNKDYRIKLTDTIVTFTIQYREKSTLLHFHTAGDSGFVNCLLDGNCTVELNCVNGDEIVSCTINDPSIAEIAEVNDRKDYCNYKINGLQIGEAVITAKTADGRTASCTIRVLPFDEMYPDTTTECTTVISDTTTTETVTDTTATAASGSDTTAPDVTTTTMTETTDVATPISEIASTTTTTTTTNVTNTDLPQTGNNSKTNILIAAGAMLLTAAGAWAMSASGILRRKEDA